jgi:Set1/Ash2 histone methyltransferase complex subunit ASH2
MKKRKFSKPELTSQVIVEEPIPEKKVQFCQLKKAPNLKLSQDNMTVSGAKGHNSVIANYPMIEGTYYFEVKIEKANSPNLFTGVEPQIRIGVAAKEFDREISLGSDDNSYAYKSVDGYRIHKGFKDIYGERYSEGDVIGCLIHMEPLKPKTQAENGKSQKEINEGSKIIFFKNGVYQGIAFENLVETFYYAGVSLYMNAKARINFGPEFEVGPELSNISGITIDDIKPYSQIPFEKQKYRDIDFQ